MPVGLVQSLREIDVFEPGRRKAGIEGLDACRKSWRVAFQSAHISGQRAAILADLAVAPVPRSTLGGDIIEVPERFDLPKLPEYALGLIVGPNPSNAVQAAADHLRASFGRPEAA